MNIVDDFKAVRSSLDISRSLKFYLSMCDHEKYGDGEKVVRALNDTLQGRSERTVEELLSEVDMVCGGWKDYDEDRAMLHQRIQDFRHQKALLSKEYTKTSDRQYNYEMLNGQKVIDQQLYDQAAKDGFPAGFFRNSFFHRVTFYCLPDGQDCCGSTFDLCTFAVCRINFMVNFECAFFYNCEFHSCKIDSANFQAATMAHTRFYDCSLKNVSFIAAYMRSCNMTDCKLERINFRTTTLDGCSFDRVAARVICNLYNATFTQSGATAEEMKQNREAIFAALRPERGVRKEVTTKKRSGR